MKSLHYFYISFKTQKTYVFQCRTVSNLSYIVFLKTMGVSCSKRAIGLLNPHPYMFYSFSLLNLNYLIIYEYRINRKLVTKTRASSRTCENHSIKIIYVKGIWTILSNGFIYENNTFTSKSTHN